MRIITVISAKQISSSSRRLYYIKSVLNYVGHHKFYCKFNNFFLQCRPETNLFLSDISDMASNLCMCKVK